MYIKAFVDFGCQFGNVLEVHFIDLNQDILDLIRTAYEGWVADPSTLSYDNDLTKQSSNQQRGNIYGIFKLINFHHSFFVQHYFMNE